MEQFSKFLDRHFALKDRLYSLIWYIVPGNAPQGVIEAHSNGCLSDIDFEKIKRGLRFHIPKLLPFVLFLFAGTMYLSWNADYRPPGITSRIVLKPLSSGEEGSRQLNEESNSDLGQNPESEGPVPEGEGAENPLSEAKSEEEQLGERQEQPGATGEDSASSGNGLSPMGSGAGGQEGSGEGRQVDLAAPDTIESITVTDKVSPPVPSNLESRTEKEFATLPDAKEFLNLIPGQGGEGVAPLDQSVIENFRSLMVNYPTVYREQLETYYRELMKWEEKR
ncbi:MAG: hypothetical protein RRA15_09230 [bacterium]|nr:hypothetical protein [bacterium]MDT8366663.1 hypothetical protein [bacterium]